MRAYLACSRPFTWLAVLVGVAAATMMAIRYDHTTWAHVLQEWRHLAYGAATLLIVVIGNNFVNQSTDREDEVNKEYRPVVKGYIRPDEAATIGHLLWIMGILRAATLGTSFGVIVTLLVLICYAYSHPPVRLKARLWLGNVSIAFARGGLGFLAAWSLWAPVSAPEALAAAGVLTVFLVGATTAKDFSDEAGDRRFGVQTLVVRYGPKTAANLSAPFILSPILLLPLLNLTGILRVPIWAIAGSGVILFYFLERMFHANEKRNGILEGSPAWVLMYVSLLALQATFAA